MKTVPLYECMKMLATELSVAIKTIPYILTAPSSTFHRADRALLSTTKRPSRTAQAHLFTMSVHRLPNEASHTVIDASEKAFETLVCPTEDAINFPRFSNFRSDHLGSMLEPVVKITQKPESAFWYTIESVDHALFLSPSAECTRSEAQSYWLDKQLAKGDQGECCKLQDCLSSA